MPAKKPAGDKVFDVAKPGTSTPDIGSKPMIVGHKSMAADPMMREKADAEEHEASGAPKVQPSKLKISPFEVEDLEENTKNLETQVDEKTDPVEDSATKEKQSNDDDLKVSIVEEKSEKPKQNLAKVPAALNAHDQAEDEKSESVSVTAKDIKTDEKQKEIDPMVVESERDENLKKLIASKKYKLNIKETKERPSRNTLLMAVLLLLAGVAGLFAAIDTGALDLGFELPLHIFGQQKVVDTPPSTINPSTPVAKAQPETVVSSPAIPEGYVQFKNEAYAYSIWYPKTLEPSSAELGVSGAITDSPVILLSATDKELPCCSLTIESLTDSQGDNKQKIIDLYKQSGIKSVAEESQRVNRTDTNQNIENKTVSEVVKKKRLIGSLEQS